MPLALLIPLIAQLAPSLVKWIAGDDAGEVTQKVANVVAGVIGNTADPQAAFHALPPEQQVNLRLALAKIEADTEAAKRADELDTLKAELADTANARARDATMRSAGQRNVRADVIVAGAYLTMIACIVAITASALKNWALTGEVIALYSTLIVGCIAILKDCSAFEFGTSRSSRDKDATIAALSQNGH